MSHDIEAAYASSELAKIITSNSKDFFGNIGKGGAWSVRAAREAELVWPFADGLLVAESTLSNIDDIQIALEYKRPNEGIHGILTALGQSFAYLEKGYNASVIVIPEQYATHTEPGEHIKRVIDLTAPEAPIWVYTYSQPDMSAKRPFEGKLNCVRNADFQEENTDTKKKKKSKKRAEATSTLWAHMREGISYPDAFFKYCYAVKLLSVTEEDLSKIIIPDDLKDAVKRIAPGVDVFKYLSSTTNNEISDKVWRYVWFNYYFWNDLMPLFSSKKPYTVNSVETKVLTFDGKKQRIFDSRPRDSIKYVLTRQLNGEEECEITEEKAWEIYAERVNSVAHSYREIIDSGLYHIGFLSPEGTLTDLGYKYVEACERTFDANKGVPMEILRAAVLQNGQYGALIHYIYRFSEELFSENMYAYTKQNKNGTYKFKSKEYRAWLDGIFKNELYISKKSTKRAKDDEKKRPPLQAEVNMLKGLGFIKKKNDNPKYRVGVGFEIDWPQVQSSMLYFQTL